jgi:hypothetical protein
MATIQRFVGSNECGSGHGKTNRSPGGQARGMEGSALQVVDSRQR